MKVFNVFKISGDGDSYSSPTLLAVCTTIEVAKKVISKKLKELDIEKQGKELVHISMKKENDYTYVGNLENCSNYVEYGYFGGFVITETEVITEVNI